MRSARTSTGASSQTVTRALHKQGSRSRIDEDPSASGDDPHLTVDQTRDEPALAFTKILFAITLEQLAPGEADGFLDFGIAVDERQAKPPGQAAPDRRLSHSHQSDQNHRPIQTLGQ